ncbi:hypothetical protein CLV30_11398 [Haloactinopolyspora alba]|uniref:Uncharacterized protein n=1 Tax=Haloactinopolyspora alba TaxID=648780 RepID=A0A2P8DWL1_9ACTN|nr:hypothetical protein CLV30_11398 [Haloactinopolyspora alba]
MSETYGRPHPLAGMRRWIAHPRRGSQTVGLLLGVLAVLALLLMMSM